MKILPARSKPKEANSSPATSSIDPSPADRSSVAQSSAAPSLAAPASAARRVAPRATAARQRRKEARPQELLDAALDLFVERGFAATRSEDVAIRAGVSKGTLYLYYPSKEELLKAVIRHNVVTRIDEGLQLIRGHHGSTSELLAAILHLWWERIGETRASGILKLMMSEVRNFPELAQFYVDEVVEPSNRMLALVIERGIARAEFRAVDTLQAVFAMVAPLVYLVLNKHSLGACATTFRLEPRQLIDTLVDLMLRGLLPRDVAVRQPQPA